MLLWFATLGGACAADQTWQQALARMTLPSPAPLLNRDNAVCVLLNAFRSNDLVKALVVLPGVSDDFYLVNRDQPRLNLRATNLLDAVSALTNATSVRATFQAPFLLLHIDGERLQPRIVIQDETTARRLKAEHHLPHALYCDTHWERLQPGLQKTLERAIRPEAQATEAWRFDRHNLTGWGLSDWELLVAIALAGRTGFTLQKQAIVFRVQPAR